MSNASADSTSKNIDHFRAQQVFVFHNGVWDQKAKVFKPGPITHNASQDFAAAIYDEIHAGYGFTPLLGAGFSVSAGIPIINQLKTYLQRCICAALGVEKKPINPDEPRHLWNPRTDRWPPLIDRSRMEDVEDNDQSNWKLWMRDRLDAELDKEKHGDSTANPGIYQEAYGAMAEWRTSLLFISRIVFDRKRVRIQAPQNQGKHNDQKILSDPQLVPRLGEPSQSVIDAGWREWMRDKRPTLNHRMLATVSSLLRIDTILSTNFDDLVERAFEQSRTPLQVFDVRLMDGLPERELVTRARSIVKMHGSTRSLRADYSLDGEPSVEDKRLFTEYLAGEQVRVPTNPETKRLTPMTQKHLLVSGVAATEHRTVSFITHALETLPDLRVFWVCYTEDDVQAIIRYASSLPDKAILQDPKRARIYVLRHTEIALLLLHIYQSIRKTLPPSNALYPSVTQLSVPPLPQHLLSSNQVLTAEQERTRKILRAEQDRFRDKIIKHIQTYPLCVATAPKNVGGVMTVCEEIFREFEAKSVCLWIDLSDIYSIDELFEVIQESAYYKLGQRDWTPLYSSDDAGRPRKLEVARIADSSIKSFLIFLNAREKPGSNRTVDQESSNTWLDEIPNIQLLSRLLDDLRDARKGAFKVIILAEDNTSPLVEHLRLEPSFGEPIVLEKVENVTPDDDPDKAIEKIIQWLGDAPTDQKPQEEWKAKLRFLHTLALMQKARHLAINWARCTQNNGDTYWSDFDKDRPNWLIELEDLGLIRRIDGGFVWMHSHLREKLRAKFIGDPNLLGCKDRAEIQKDIAFWYLKLFDSTGTPPAIFEAIDHLCFSVAHLIVGALGYLETKSTTEDREAAHLKLLAQQDIAVATKRVKAAQKLLHDHQWLIHTQGYPRASSRRLEHISRFWLQKQWMTQKLEKEHPDRKICTLLDEIEKKLKIKIPEMTTAIASLQQEAARIRLMIAREIGEDRKAYELLYVVSGRLMRRVDKSDEKLTELLTKQTPLHEQVKKYLASAKEDENDEDTKAPKRHRWMNWWYLCGLLGIASRSYNEAEISLAKALNILSQDDIEDPTSNLPVTLDEAPGLKIVNWQKLLEKSEFDFKLKKNKNEKRNSDAYLVYCQALEVMEQAAQLLILRANAAEREVSLVIADKSSWFHLRPDQDKENGEENNKKTEEDKKNHEAALKAQKDIKDIYDSRRPKFLLETAENIAIKALILVEQIQDSGITRADQDSYLMGTKARLLQIAALASRYAPERKLHHRHAMSLMGDASATLSEAEPIFAHADYAIIDLREAQIRLQEAASVKLYGQFEFETWTHDRLRGKSIRTPIPENNLSHCPRSQFEIAQELQIWWIEEGAEQKNQEPDSPQYLRNNLREITSRATDAIRFLDRAEPTLRERRRNVAWTTRYFEMRLRAIAMILWATVVQKNTPIPYLGLEAAMRRTDTEPDQLLKDALRMIRTDSFRLAMVILTYASCARALQIRLALDPEAVRLPDRLEQMSELLKEAIKQLEFVHNRRDVKDLQDSNTTKKARVNDVVERVVLETIKRAKDVSIGLAEPI